MQWVDPRRVLPLHELRRPHHFAELVSRMRRHGWQGRPLLVEVLADAKYRMRASGHFMNWTGTHRLAAARAAGLTRVPVVFVNRGRPMGRLPAATRTTTDPHRYQVLRFRRDPTSVMMYAELRINAIADAARVL